MIATPIPARLASTKRKPVATSKPESASFELTQDDPTIPTEESTDDYRPVDSIDYRVIDSIPVKAGFDVSEKFRAVQGHTPHGHGKWRWLALGVLYLASISAAFAAGYFCPWKNR